MANIILLAVCLLAGIILKKTGRFPAATPAALNGFIIHISLPALAILHIHSITIEKSLILTASMAWLLFGAAWVLFSIAGKAFKLDRQTVGALVLMGGLGNTSFLGLPMIEAYYGKENIGIGIIADQLGSFMVLSTLGILVATICS
ncbi:MAG: AEC family transporter, partial [Desulfuromonadaceae bacterium]|nr:AEC family transporter [Desulfuromonadaceae bacterium]